MRKYFMTMAVMAVFAIGFAASDDTDSSSSSSSYSSPQPEPKKEHEFFENGYAYSTVYTVRYAQGYGGHNLTNYFNLKMYKDGTKEVTFSYDPGTGRGRSQERTEKFEIKKRSGSSRDIYATWYEIEWTYDYFVGNDYRRSAEHLYVDEKGNIIELGVNGNSKDIYEAISTGDCIFGKFTKKPL